jgi:hypothetical protein
MQNKTKQRQNNYQMGGKFYHQGNISPTFYYKKFKAIE